MKLETSFGFIRLTRGISTADEFVEQNRILLAKLLSSSYQVFTSYKHVTSSVEVEGTDYFVVDLGDKDELGKYLEILKDEFAPDLSCSHAFDHHAPESVMGKWAMKLISKK